jgi:hypothetical protein
VSTQSNVSPSGSESRTSTVRSRIIGSTFWRLRGCTDGVTVRRWSRCSGGSIAMNVMMRSSCGGSRATGMPSVMPAALEYVCQSVSTALMSWYLVTDQ